MVLSFLLKVFSISVCHCLKGVIYKKVCVCVRACVCVCVSVCVCDARRLPTKNLLSLECVAGHQKASESEIRTHIGNTLKI